MSEKPLTSLAGLVMQDKVLADDLFLDLGIFWRPGISGKDWISCKV